MDARRRGVGRRGRGRPRTALAATTALELADSYATNPHKWLLTNFDCDAFWVADRAALIGALSILPEYLRNAASESGRGASTTATGTSRSGVASGR